MHTLWRRWSVDSRLAAAFLAAPSSLLRRLLLSLLGAALEVALMAALGGLGAKSVLGLPGPLAVAIAAVVGIFAGPLAAALVSATGAISYVAFLSHFGRTIDPGVLVASSLLWVVLSVLIALAAAMLRRQVAARIASQRHTDELYRRLEESLLPRSKPSHPVLWIASYYQPGERGLRLSGDFFDLAVLTDGTLALVIGDVSGHGPRAAALGAILRGAWRGLVGEASPTAAAHALHQIALSEGAADDAFATALFAWVDVEHNLLRAISAGHPAPLLLGSDVSELNLDSRLPLGIFDQAPAWQVSSIELPESWTLFFYTDGLIDMRLGPDSSERYGIERLRARLRSLDGHALDDDAVAQLVEGFAEQSGQPPEDDVALVVVSKGSPLASSQARGASPALR
jgi:serine phosphatase RsbU (regulator of sigma subunit)